MKKTLRVVLAITLAAGALRLSASEFNQRLANLSTRTQVGTGANVAIVGFVVGPGASKNVLIRAVGPGLAGFGVTGTLSDPRIDLFDGSGKIIVSNDNWSATTVGGATTFGSVGAFGLTTNSRDAALVANLAPGAYTAQVSGVGTATGIALVEVYDVTGTARLMNLSTRAQIGTGAGILISGLSIAPDTGRRQILVRAAGPALAAFGVTGAISDPTIAIINSANVQIASNDNWSSNASALSAAFIRSGAFAFDANSKDAAIITDLAPGNYTIQVSGVAGATGAALVEVYDITPDNLATVTISASTPVTDTKGGAPGVYTFNRTGPTAAPLTAYYDVDGSATPGFDYTALPGSVTFPVGASSVTVNLAPRTDGASDTISRSATVTLATGAGYSIGGSNAASVTIFYNPGTNYITSLRAPSTAPTSTAYGTATVQLSGDSKFAMVNVTFSNLSSPETVAYLRYGNPGEVGVEVLRLPNGQVNGTRWDFTASGALSAADLVQALKDGRIFLSVESATYPAGEIKGTFIQNSASLVFNPPDAAPALADVALTANDAARFLTQATFGPSRVDIDALTGKRQVDLANWITAQIALPPSLHLAATDTDFQTFAVGDNPQYSQVNRQAAWWKIAVTSPDQLRQRVAFALSQILVVSDANATLANTPRGLASYYDILVSGAFGNFRTLLENVTLSPVMGIYLSALRNTKGTVDKNGVVTSADENYAREVMQLFTVGLNLLQPDGTLKLDPTGLPMPTYNQATIAQTAKVFTGWAFQSADATSTNAANNFRNSASDYLHPMMLYPGQHDDTSKTVIGGVIIPANQGGAADLAQELDTLFNHPNTGPFISRQLIQRLVTSNPSPGYIYRVAQVFANNGSGVRGDLGAVVRAILTDYEARSSAVAATASFGKLKEPLLRATSLLRAFNGAANNGRFLIFYNDSATTTTLAQYPLHAPTVFNFFEPNFTQPGSLAAAGLYAPEYQILTDTTAIAIPNQLWNFIYTTRAANPANDGLVGILFDSLIPYSHQPAALVDQVNTILAAGSMSKATTDRLTAVITAMPTSTVAPSLANNNDAERVRSAIYLALSTQQGATQK